MGSEIVGLDSLKLKNKTKILKINKVSHSEGKDTSITYAKAYNKKDITKPDIIIRNIGQKNEFKIISNDTTYYLDPSENTYRKHYSRELYLSDEISYFYFYIYLKKNLHHFFSVHNKMKKITQSTVINPSENTIEFYSKDENLSTDITSIHSLIISTLNFDTLEIQSEVLKYNDTINQLSLHNIFTDFLDTTIENELDDIYYKWKNNKFTLKEKINEIISNNKVLEGKSIKIDYKLSGLNRNSFALEKEITKNKYTIIYIWGSWCAPCLSNIENIEKFYEFTKIPFYTLMFEYDKNPIKKMDSYIKTKKPSYPVYYNNDFVEDNKFLQFPIFLIIDNKGKIAKYHSGKVDNANMYIDLIRNLIK